MTAALALNTFDSPHISALITEDRQAVRARRNDAAMDIRELQALRLDVDTVAPPEAATIAEPLVDLYRGQLTSGDSLRLPQMTSLSSSAIRGAVGRVITTNLQAASASRDAVAKEKKMHMVLRALDEMVSTIQHQSNMAMR